ncbi:DUF2309 domain-containing protein [Gangjinia marincola]|uniref:Probable inorganic carbon transporter subunit DabA n=1 Tax=Gangjinia marincola TaxID=578463 RepID=A0ABN1MIV0_9FLAO
MSYHTIKTGIEEASNVIGKTWPLYSFVTSNPLAGYEKLPFTEAVSNANKMLNVSMFPKASVYREALETGEIKEKILVELLAENGFTELPQNYLNQLEANEPEEGENPSHQLDRIMAKWLSAFMDEGLAEWEMPRKEEGFFTAWRELAAFDNELKISRLREIPKTAEETLIFVLKGVEENDYSRIFWHHLASLPGWTGYINYRTASGSGWQNEFPISLEEYLAVRLFIAKKLDLNFIPKEKNTTDQNTYPALAYIWLKAWEKSWQGELKHTLKDQAIHLNDISTAAKTPDAQMAFCIDTRSELIRRNVESKGNYETFGYAGFFGIAMDYANPDDGITRKSCPPIVGSAYTVSERAQDNKAKVVQKHHAKNAQWNFFQYFLKRMKNMLPSAFGYVEGTGVFYGIASILRTLFPGWSYRTLQKQTSSYETVCEPHMNLAEEAHQHNHDIPLTQKVGIVKSAFDLTGWKNFAPLVLFAGHGSHSANNPFGSSLDCGACAASPGKHNARMLAKLANEPQVRDLLATDHGYMIPKETIFIGAQHNTTTDEIELFDSHVPASHQDRVAQLKRDLKKAQQTATQERLGIKNGVRTAHQKANHWGETRPEWGLAKNASFIVAPRSLTKEVNLDGRCFLHSYDWEHDKKGKALEGIMQGPMVVTQWINNHYYFSTVDNDAFGGGSKITHNITGRFGVVQGNGGDLKMGLPLQSVSQTDTQGYHKPLRLSVLIHAPVQRISEILLRNESLKTLLDNEWIYLMVMDPKQQNEVFTYGKNMNWEGDTPPISKTKVIKTKSVPELVDA